ncbi:hypothetical protein PQZ42_00115 [Alphaproteobacteria bacterium]|nr:hypothetical protein [Alphaproteobacteria bacterium]
MKIKPEILFIKNDESLFKNILVAGSDEVLITYVTEYFVKNFKKKKYFVNSTGFVERGLVGDLFSDKKILFLLKEPLIKKGILETSDSLNQCFIISSPNSKKINGIKKKFANEKDMLLVECYPLNRSSKEMVVKDFVRRESIKISNNVFWYIVESFENNYVLLNQQLELLSIFNKEINSIAEVEKVVAAETKIEINKIFFHILKNKNILINMFNRNIYSQADFYIFLNSFKVYLSIISDSQTKDNALSKFPKYLFNEKDVFVQIYNQLNDKKIKKIYSNVLRVESLVRKNSNLYLSIGLRFFLNTKSIIIS